MPDTTSNMKKKLLELLTFVYQFETNEWKEDRCEKVFNLSAKLNFIDSHKSRYFPRMGARMFHPSSGRDNFDVVSEKESTTNRTQQSSRSTNSNQSSIQPINQTEVEKNIKDAIKSATKSSSQTSSNNPVTDKRN